MKAVKSDLFQLCNYNIREQSEHTMDKLAFDLVAINEQVCHTIIAGNETEKLSWIKAIREAKEMDSAPITDICVIHRGEQVPLGYIPIYETYYNHPGNVNEGMASKEIFICYEKNGIDEEDKPKHPITDISIIFTDSSGLIKRQTAEAIPKNEGWRMIQKTFYGTSSADINLTTSGREIYILYKRESNKPPLVALTICYAQKDEVPSGYNLLTYTVTGKYEANLNSGNS